MISKTMSTVKTAVEQEEEEVVVKPIYGRRRMKPRPPTNETGIRFIKYSDAAYALLGNTISLRFKIGEIGCKYNPNLKDPESGQTVPGWVCRRIMKPEVVKMLEESGVSYMVIDE